MRTDPCHACSTVMEARDLKQCANCKLAFYCSKECQKVHWKRSHKAVCSDNAAVLQNVGESPKEKARSKEMRYWMNAWSPAIICCLPLALDLANHEWGRHDTHTLVIFTENTGLDGDHRSHRVIKAAIGRVADLVKTTPSIKDVPQTDPPCPGMTCLRCFFFFSYGGPAKAYYARSRAWWVKDLRGRYYGMDKEHSRATSRLAIPHLMNEINFLRDPQQAEERFRLMAFGSDIDIPRTPMEEDNEKSPT